MKVTPRFHQTDFFKAFWQTGNGSEMVEMSGAQVSLDRFDEYAHLYYEADLLGDEAAKELFFSRPFPEAMQMVEDCAKNGVASIKKLPESFKKLCLQTAEIPAWVNLDLLEKGSELCRKSALSGLIVLRDFTLMGGYDFAYLNKPLIFTGALKKGAVKRLTDTLEFWVNVTRKGALAHGARGYQLCARTRLIHSYSRLMIMEKVKDWDTGKWGLPINTWDMIATYIGFSLSFLLGIKKMGIEVSEKEERGLFHLWKYIGYLIGIPPAYIPNNAKEATETFYLWTTIQPKADADSIMLAEALLNENLETTIYKSMRFRRRLKYLHICCVWYLLDEDTNLRLKIPRVKMIKLFPRFVFTRNKWVQAIRSRKAQIRIGDTAQAKVLELYLDHRPKDGR